MALTIEDIHNRIFFVVQKNRWDHVSHEEVDICLDMAQQELFYFYYGDPEKYQYGRPIPPVAHGQNQMLHDSLIPFIKQLTLTVDGTGTPTNFTALPSTYVHLDSAFIVDSNSEYLPLDMVGRDKVAYRQKSQLMPAKDSSDLSHPFITLMEDGSGNHGIQVFPKTGVFPSGVAYYLSAPVAPQYAYTQVGRTITWDEGSSVNLQWNEPDVRKIMTKAIQYIGQGIKDVGLVQFGQIKDKT